MEIISSFLKCNDDNAKSQKIITRYITIITPLKFECIKKIATLRMPMHAMNITLVGITDLKSHILMDIDDVHTSSFPRFLYEIMDLEKNCKYWNE